MPYISQEKRRQLKYERNAETAGELNYIFTKTITNYIDGSPSYQKFNDVIGALECCKLELYRRMIAPYEDNKAIENGDVF